MKNPSRNLRIMRNTVRVLATVGILFKTLYFGPIGAGAALVDGLALAAIWITRESDPK